MTPTPVQKPCPVCGKPVPGNEANAYQGRHEDCVEIGPSELSSRPIRIPMKADGIRRGVGQRAKPSEHN